ncbi:GH39 family glycosyl hydrolase [Chitinophaga pinensis]|uniref:Glycoside hydrolase family 39 n=1 Tax=Chitinophaga pinensis (strain ATCC 43595 / DSM 2588 / LMG 13176 / NBRC 15968 / NCIMB 11800 / UQM 2034) TaxID=485918 RepID=A0A979G8F4_CHIPD|nr:beta-xylosidase [Chitinophaga pinensis]ACU62582.1 glycoside hydrolase family 39 [Chitinophaga pinensis DSM 2588]
MKKILLFSLCIALGDTLSAQSTPTTLTDNIPASIEVRLGQITGPMKPVWAWFGYDEPNYTYMKDGKKLLSEIAALSPVPVYVRTHSLLVSGDGVAALKWGSTNVYTEDANGQPVYNWTIIDSIFDTYINRGMKPLAQIGFMPQALSTHPEPYRHYWKPGDPYTDIITGWAYPPKDYDKWRELAYQWAKHSVERYGQKEVESWYWEVWNEPNGHYWKGTREEFFKLYDYAADGIKKALSTARIGGINIAGTSSKTATEWTTQFIEHCISGTNYATGKTGAPLDALLFHAKGNPKLVNGIVRMNMSPQLRDIAAGFRIAASYPQTRNLPLIIGESDPEGCAACGMATNPENAYRNGTLYSSYTAASFARKYLLADQYAINFLGAVSWSFEFENQPWFYGFRDLATNGVDKPVLNVFRMFGMMRGDRVNVSSSRMYPLETVLDSSIRGQQTEIGALASKAAHTAAAMVWNYHDEDKKGPAELVNLTFKDVPAQKVIIKTYLIDSDHSNSYEVWKKMGSPQHPTKKQISTLEKAGKLQIVQTIQKASMNGEVQLPLRLQRQAVALVTLSW